MGKGPLAQGRRVRLVVRRVEPWTVLKFSVLLFATLYLVILVAGVVLWGAATATGLRGNVESFIGELVASDDFKILGPTMFRASVIGGFMLVLLGTGANVLLAVLYNLISDVVGGVVVVFEERPGRRQGPVPAGKTGDERREPLVPGSGDGDERPQPLVPARSGRRRRAPAAPDTTPDPMDPDEPPQRAEPARLTRPSD